MFTFPLKKEQIKELNEKDIETLIFLDENGLFPSPAESFTDYKNRLIKLEDEVFKLQESAKQNITDSKDYVIPELMLKEDDLIKTEKYTQVQEKTEHYSFMINWAPGFFAKKRIGFLAGGATLISETGFPVFLLKASFKEKDKWFLYDITELLSHEFCHVARAPLNDRHFEEFFAYKISPSRFRRYIGSFFHSPIDSLLMLIPFFLLISVSTLNVLNILQLNETFFWILCFLFPIFLFFRNNFYHKKYISAFEVLKKQTTENLVDSILFRCSSKEISEIAKLKYSGSKEVIYFVRKLFNTSFRWKIIIKRFIPSFSE